MPISIQEFWKLTIASGLVALATAQQLHAKFAGLKGASQQANAASLAEWLVAEGTLTRYQANILLAGRPGPFVFGDFVLSERIETGRLIRSFRATYKKTHTALLVFWTQLPPSANDDDLGEERTCKAIAVKNPHVNRVHQFVEASQQSFIVLEDLPGQSLREYLATHKPGLQLACRFGFQVALGLSAVHAQQAVHGNLCPENMWIDPTGQTVKLLQFPLVCPLAAAERLRVPAVDYLAPELAMPERTPNALTDVYALGCLLYELIAGRIPFPGGMAADKLPRHQREIPQRLDRVVSGVPEDLADLVAEMLDKEPWLRAQTASHVAHLLAPFTSGAAERTARPPKTDPTALAPGYGAWKAPELRPPPQLAKPAVVPQSVPAPAQGTQGNAPAEPVQAKPAPPQPVRAKPVPARHVQAKPVRSAPPSDTPASAPAGVDEAPTVAGETELADDWDPPFVKPLPGTQPAAAESKRFASNTALVGTGVALAVVLAIVLAGFAFSGSAGSPTEPEPGSAGAIRGPLESAPPENNDAVESAAPDKMASAEPTPTNTPSAASPPPFQEIDDDLETLWSAPPPGEPLALDYVPASAQVFLVLRPAEILAQAEGTKLLDALGPAGETARATLQADLGVELTAIEQLTIGFLPDDAGAPQAAYVMRLRDPFDQEKLLAAWGKPSPAQRKSPAGIKRFFQGARLAYYAPDEGQKRVVAIAPKGALQEMLDLDTPPPRRRAIEALLRHTDSTRHVNLLFAPSYLLTDGKSLLVGDLERLRDPLARFLDDSLQAVLVSAQLGDMLFLELRAVGTTDKSPQDLAQQLRARLEKLPEQIESYMASLAPSPYGRLIVNRFPRMVQLLVDYTRCGAEDRQAVLRCYLPGQAAHNLLLGAELTLFEQPSAGGLADSRPRSASDALPASAPRGAAAALQKKISLSFPRDTLEHCLELLAKEIDTEVVIEGRDLQLEGITKNQSFGLDERDRMAGDILKKVLELANPDGKLIWVIKPKGQAEAIFITTRAAAAKRKDPLPAEFTPPAPRKKP